MLYVLNNYIYKLIEKAIIFLDEIPFVRLLALNCPLSIINNTGSRAGFNMASFRNESVRYLIFVDII